MRRLRGLFVIDKPTLELVYGPHERASIARLVEMVGEPQTRETIAAAPSILESVEVLFSGWTPPRFDEAFFERAPNLKVIFYAAGPVQICQSAHRRGVQITTAHVANSQPVAEYSLATILFSLKHGWRLARETRELRTFVHRDTAPGCYETKVGIIGLGKTGRALLKLLRPFDVNVMAFDPHVGADQAMEMGAQKVSLDHLFRTSDVVSLQAPLNASTRDMIGREQLAVMKQGATFLNAARGAIVRTDELIQVARERPDLQFVLDVTDPLEPPPKHSPLYELDNVVLTPHIAGSAGGECRRLGHYMVEELKRYVAGQPLRWAVPPEPQAIETELKDVRKLRVVTVDLPHRHAEREVTASEA